MKTVVALAIAVMFSLTLFACGGKGGDCDKAADHILKIMKKDMEKMFEGMPKEQADKAKAEMEKELNKDELVKECKKKKFTKGQFDCVMKANAMEDLMKCEKE